MAHGADWSARGNRWRVPCRCRRGWCLDPRAERWVQRAFSLERADVAILSANASRRVPQTVVVRVRVAGTLAFVQEVASLDALGLVRRPPACCHLGAIVCVVVLVATVAAAAAVDVPLALAANIGIARRASVVPVRAAVPASSAKGVARVRNELAHRGCNAVTAVQDSRA